MWEEIELAQMMNTVDMFSFGQVENFCERFLTWNCLRFCPRCSLQGYEESQKQNENTQFYTHGMKEKCKQLVRETHSPMKELIGISLRGP